MIAAVLLAALAPLAIVGFVAYSSQQAIAIDIAFERLEGIAAAQVGQLDAIVRADREISEVLVAESALRDGLVNGDAEEVGATIGWAVDEVDRLESVIVVDSDGDVVAASDETAIARLDGVRKHLSRFGPFEGVVVEGKDGDPVVLCATPVLLDGEEIGRIITETSLQTITALVTNYEGLSATGETSIAQRHVDGGAEFIAPFRFREGEGLGVVVPPTEVDAPIIRALAGDVERLDGVADYRNESVLAVTRTVAGPNWAVVVKMDRAEALAGMSTFRNALIGAAVVGGLLVIAMAVWFARWVSRPIQRLTEVAAGVARGDLGARADIHTDDEIGALATAVATMTDTLVEATALGTNRISELEAVNAELVVSDARGRSIVDHAAEGIVPCSGAGIIEAVNPAAARLLGRPAEVIEGLPFGAFFGVRSAAGEVAVDRENLLEWIWSREHEVVGLYARRNSVTKIPLRISVSRAVHEDGVSFHALVRDVSESVDFERRLWESAHYDGLTGLPNRELLLAELEQLLAGANVNDLPGVLFVDLDRFKVVNDAWGHAAGDQLLQLVADRLRGAMRRDDLLARFGGDEFVVVARTHDGVRDLTELGRRIIRELEAPFRLGDNITYVGASVGLVVGDGTQRNADDLVSQADVAMYTAKSKGRGQVSVFDAAMRERVRSRHQIHTDLRRAIDNDELTVHYQPIVNLASGEFEGAEALVRWEHPTRGLLAPSAFIPVAEETGLVTNIGQYVLRHVAGQIAEWSQRNDGSPRIAVNLSARELMDPQLVKMVLDTLAAAGASPSNLTVEVTESVLVSDASTAIANLARLQHAGVLIALDDFGTGYSSLTYLHDMPVDIVKIDRRFVTELAGPRAESSIAAMVLGLGKTLGLWVVAEGVETLEQHERLIGVGGTYAQGFLYARPVPAAEFADLMWPADHAMDLRRVAG